MKRNLKGLLKLAGPSPKDKADAGVPGAKEELARRRAEAAYRHANPSYLGSLAQQKARLQIEGQKALSRQPPEVQAKFWDEARKYQANAARFRAAAGAFMPGLGLLGASGIIGAGDTAASRIEGNDWLDATEEGARAGLLTYLGGKALEAAGRYVVAPAFRHVRNNRLFHTFFPGKKGKAPVITDRFIDFLRKRQQAVNTAYSDALLSLRQRITPAYASRLSKNTGIPASDIYKAYRMGSVDDISSMYNRLRKAGVTDNIYIPFGKSTPVYTRSLIDRAILPKDLRQLAFDRHIDIGIIEDQLRLLGIKPTPENVIKLGPDLNRRLPGSDVGIFKDLLRREGRSLSQVLSDLRSEGVTDAIWHGDGIGSPSLMSTFDRTWWSGNPAVSFGYGLSPTSNLANKGIHGDGNYLSVLPLRPGTTVHTQAHARFTPHVVDSMTPEGSELARRIMAGEKVPTWHETTTAATRAPNYETILDKNVFSPNVENVRTYRMFPQKTYTRVNQSTVPVVSGVDDLPIGAQLYDGVLYDDIPLVPKDKITGRVYDIPFLRNRPTYFDPYRFVQAMSRRVSK